MKITYIYHSCYVVEFEDKVLIFDYYKKSDDEGYVVVKNPIKDKRY